MQYIYVLGPKEQWGIQLLAENKKAETGTPFLSLLANQKMSKKKKKVSHRPRTNRINIIPTPDTPANLLAPLLRSSLPQFLFDTRNTNVLDVVFL